VADLRDELLREIDEHLAAIRTLESRLPPTPAASGWPPKGFYLTFYVVSGLLIGILGSLTSFLANVLGSLWVRQDPLLFLRVYGTFFLGPKALTTDDLNFFMLVAVVHFSVGAVAGAVFQVLVSRFVPDNAPLQIILGVLYGLLMWLVNHYVVIAWMQPQLVGRPYVLDLMPVWVGALSHAIYGLTLGILQPLGRFRPYRRMAEAA
jgi:hypothetical protein